MTDEWNQRGVKEQVDYAILTAEISKATFGLTPTEYKEVKGLKKENLRDHMSDLELIFSMLGEASTTEITRNTDARGFEENKEAAKKGGKIAGDARKALELESGKKVITDENFYPKKKRSWIRRKNSCSTANAKKIAALRYDNIFWTCILIILAIKAIYSTLQRHLPAIV